MRQPSALLWATVPAPPRRRAAEHRAAAAVQERAAAAAAAAARAGDVLERAAVVGPDFYEPNPRENPCLTIINLQLLHYSIAYSREQDNRTLSFFPIKF